MNLRIPGPTPCPPETLQAMAHQMINHRGREFAELIHRVTKNLKIFFETQDDVLILTASGTGSLEAAVVNTLSPGERALALPCGLFGDRFADIAQAYGADVVRLHTEWGNVVSPKKVRQALAKDPTIKAVLVTHNETSTGVTNDLEKIAAIVREFDKLLLVDAVSSLGSIPVRCDAWGLDVVVTASQKGWMTPPGLAMVSVSPRAWAAYQQARMPRFYFDLKKSKDALEKGQTPWTPPLSDLFALDVALIMMLREGREHIFARHRRIARRLRRGLKSLGLELLAKEMHASDTVTTVRVPEGTDAAQLLHQLEDEYGIIVAEGPGKLAGKIFRIGHMGLVSKADIDELLAALAEVVKRSP